MKIGFLFAGQGAQYPGMGKSLYECSKAARKVFDDAGEEIKDRCFNGTKESLRQTQITQPCVYIVGMAAYSALIESIDIEPVGVAGFSLGEYSALTAAKVIENIDIGLKIVTRRGELMMKAGLGDDGAPIGGMTAALGKREEILKYVDSAREDGILSAVNFNSPSQTVVAGDKAALKRFGEKASGSKVKVIPLSVGTAFHTSMMRPAVEPLRQLLIEAELKKPALKIYCNLTGKEIEGSIACVMAKQAESPVRWQETIENMAADGIEILIEIGPGKALSGMVRKTAPQITTMNVEDKESLEKTVETLRGKST